MAVIVLLVALCLTGYSLWTFWSHRQMTQGDSVPIPAGPIVYSTDTPEESPPDCQSYRVADNQPLKLQIPRVGIDGCIQKVGVDQNSAVAVPTNVHLGGWYTQSVLPGEKGVSLIDGHVRGRYGDAIFTDLGSVRKGDTVRVQLGNGSWKVFEVVDLKSFSVDTATQHLFDALDGTDRQLTLVTCVGLYDKQAGMYRDRLVVRARLAQ